MLSNFLDWLTELIFPPQLAMASNCPADVNLSPQWMAFGTTGSRGVKVKGADGKTQIMGGAMGDRAGQVDKLKAAAAGGDADAAKKLQEQLGRANAGRLENQKVSAQIRQQRTGETQRKSALIKAGVNGARKLSPEQVSRAEKLVKDFDFLRGGKGEGGYVNARRQQIRNELQGMGLRLDTAKFSS